MTRLLLVALAAPVLSYTAVVGQTDTFTSGTQGWTVGLGPGPGNPPTPPTTLTGGQGGAADAFLHLTAVGGAGAGSKLVVMNVSQWAGDYLTAGITGISMDVRNSSATDLFLRLLFENLGAMGPTDEAFSTNPIFVPAGSGWMKISFPVGPASLTADIGSATTALASADVLRLFHSPTPEFPPSGPVTAVLDVDNITATGVPEPSTLLVTLAGLGIIGVQYRRSLTSRTH